QKYCRDFDLSTLADGEYTFEVSCRKEKCKQSFVIQTQNNRVVVSPGITPAKESDAKIDPVIASKN
ncbi:MAG: hypothetical protein LH606_04595, partial [Cytophagaceae bacterium]|nr:hypothetical protein [Cytophagaceae bacterium]